MAVSAWQRAKLRAKDFALDALGWVLEKLRVPALLRSFEFVDPETNETVYVYTDRLYSVLCIGSRRYYFNRITGAFDGTSASSDCVTRRIEFAD